MHRLVIRAVEEFLRDTYGDALCAQIVSDCDAVARAGHGSPDDRAAARGHCWERLVPMAAGRLGKPVGELFEDLGAWLARREAIRRLLRFSGRDFEDFVMRLDELPGRAHFVIPDLDMPRIEVRQEAGHRLSLTLPETAFGWAEILGGVLRVMADDYGTLGLIEVVGHTVQVQISDDDFAEGRDFRLGDGGATGTAGLR